MSKREIRVATGDLTADKESGTVTGYAAVFNSPTRIGRSFPFDEQIAPGAFAKSISEGADVRALIDHEPGKVLGRTKAGTLRIAEDARGLKVEIDLPDTQVARDLKESMTRGDISQMSFGFTTDVDEWDETGPVPVRTLKSVSLFDVSVVTFPAYPDTSAAVRSLESTREGRATGVALIAARTKMRQDVSVRSNNKNKQRG